MVAILYIALGMSIGIGLTLIYLQERFIRERRLLVAMGESERAKSAKMLKNLDEQWEKSCGQYKQEISEYKDQVKDLKETVSSKNASQNSTLANKRNKDAAKKLTEQEEKYRVKDDKLTEQQNKNYDLQKVLSNYKKEINELQGEITFLKGEVSRKEDERQDVPLPLDDDLVMLNDGGHLLPGSVVRAFIKGHDT